MKWVKLGRIFKASGQKIWMKTHTACPIGLPIGNKRVKIFFGTRNCDNKPSIGYIVINIEKPQEILEISDEPVLTPGDLGMFDDNGVYPGCLVENNGLIILYYMGRSNGIYPLYYMSIGIAESYDNGLSFRKRSLAPILSRSEYDPWMVSTPYVIKISDMQWKMFYLSGIGWVSLDPPNSIYNIKIASSIDGINWERQGKLAFDFNDDETNHASPCVWKSKEDVYEAVFCAAKKDKGYYLQYATSIDTWNWKRNGIPSGLELSNNGWDSACMAYPSTFLIDDQRYLLYSGNGNGLEGFGIAKSIEK